MKTRLIVFSLLLCLARLSPGQGFIQKDDPVQQKLNKIAEAITTFKESELKEINKDSTEGKFFSKPAFIKYFDQYFTLLNYQRQTFTEGNSAAVITSENETKLNLSLSKKTGSSIFSVGTALSIKDKTGSLFSGDKPTSGTLISAGYSLLLQRSKKLGFWSKEGVRNIKNRKTVLDSIYRLHVLKNPNVYPKLLAESIDLEGKIKTTEAALSFYLTHHQQGKIDSARTVLVALISDNEKKLTELKLMEPNATMEEAIENLLTSSQEKLIKKQLDNKAVNVYKLMWISFNGSYKRDNYDTYDSLLLFGKRISSKQANIWTFSSTYNFFIGRTPEFIKIKRGIFNSAYLGFSYSLSSANNYSSLDDTNVTVQTVHPGTDSTYIISTDKKLKNITRKDFQSYYKHRIGAQYTQTFGKGGFIGLNLIGSLEREKSITTSNLRTGVLFRFKDSEKDKSFVNFEIFLNLTDLNDAKDSNKDTWDRKEIGISTVIPFQKVFFN